MLLFNVNIYFVRTIEEKSDEQTNKQTNKQTHKEDSMFWLHHQMSMHEHDISLLNVRNNVAENGKAVDITRYDNGVYIK